MACRGRSCPRPRQRVQPRPQPQVQQQPRVVSQPAMQQALQQLAPQQLAPQQQQPMQQVAPQQQGNTLLNDIMYPEQNQNAANVFRPEQANNYQDLFSRQIPEQGNELPYTEQEVQQIEKLANIDPTQLPPQQRQYASGLKGYAQKAAHNIKSFFKRIGHTLTSAPKAVFRKAQEGAAAIKEGLSSKPGEFQFYTPYVPQQREGITSLLEQGLSDIQNPSAGFEPIAQQARSQFQNETVPSIAERFTALGNGQRSSAFGQQLGSAGANLEQTLAGMQAQYGLQRGNQIQQMIGLGLTPQYQSAYQPGEPGILGQMAPAAAYGFGRSLPAMLAGGGGAMLAGGGA